VSNGFYWWQYLPNGGIQWLLPMPWTSSIGGCTQYRTGAPPRSSKWPAKLVHFLSLFHLLLPWQPLGQYRVSSHPMAASNGFRSSPGHAALGNAICIALVHRHGHQNGQQWRNIRLSSPILSSTISLAKDHVMVHQNFCQFVILILYV
jgi:hypothetical protein